MDWPWLSGAIWILQLDSACILHNSEWDEVTNLFSINSRGWPTGEGAGNERTSVLDPDLDPRSSAFLPLDPGFGYGDPGSGVRDGKSPNRGHTSQIIFLSSESLVKNFRLKNTKIICCGCGSEIWCLYDPGSGIENSVYGINIPDPQHWKEPNINSNAPPPPSSKTHTGILY